MQSVRAAVAWKIDSEKVSMVAQVLINWGLTTIAYPLVFTVISLSLNDEKSIPILD